MSRAEYEANRQQSSYLGRRVGRSPLNDAELDRMAAVQWQTGNGDMVTLRLSRVTNWATRQEIVNEANRQHGERKEAR